MKRLVIAVDCDDVLVPTMAFFVDAYNKKYGTNVQIQRLHEEDYDGWGVARDVLLERLGGLQNTDDYRSLGPSEDEAEVLQDLAKAHELHVVTARNVHEAELTQAVLDRDVPGVFASLELVGNAGSKGEVCKRLNADILIDDNLHHLKDAIQLGLPPEGAILFGDYPWNSQDVTPTSLTRCKDWKAVGKEIDQLANR